MGTGEGSGHTAKASFSFLWRCVSKASCSWLSKPRDNQFFGAFTAPLAILLEGMTWIFHVDLRCLLNSPFQAISSIREQFPDSGIVKRLSILSQSNAESFFQQWPTLRQQEEAANNQLSVLGNAFHESPTRNAFSSFAAQMKGMNQLMESTSEQLSVLTRWTEPFSPSKSNSQPHSTHPHPFWHPISPRRLFPLGSSAPVTPTVTSSSPPPSTPSNSPQSILSNPSATPEPRPPTPIQIGPSLPVHNGQVHPPHVSNTLNPATAISASNHVYCVLPLTPSAAHGQPVQTLHDLILPPAAAFSASAPMYPVFMNVDCTWQYILDRVVNPSALWSSYAPSSLGDYPDIKSIWQAWDEGVYIENVGHKPAVCLTDARWGNLESQETHKRKYSSWRPRNDTKVSAYPIFT